jgi:hypothetical protein
MTKPARMTMEEIDAALTEMGRDPEAGADRFRALKMLKVDAAASVIRTEELEDGEIVKRFIRLFQAAGQDIPRIAYRKAFQTKLGDISDAPVLDLGVIPEEIMLKARKISSLKMLYKEFPEIKRPGTPRGYPAARGPAVQLEWIRRAAEKLYMDKEAAKIRPETYEGTDAIGRWEKAGKDPFGAENATTAPEAEDLPLAD